MPVTISDKAKAAMERARRGDIAGAIAVGEQALAESPDAAGLLFFLGMLHVRRLDLEPAAAHLRQAVRLAPGDPLPGFELVRVLIGLDALDEAESVLAGIAGTGGTRVERLRLEALVLSRRGDHRAAAALYRAAIAADPNDHESLGNLGLALLALGEPHQAAETLERSILLRRDQPAFRDKWADATVAAGEAETGLARARAFASTAPHDPLVRITIARLEDLLGRPEAAEAALREALALDPRNARALAAFADLMERGNRVDEMASALDRLDATGVPLAETALLRARLLYRRGDFHGALAAARSAPVAVDPGLRAQMIGLISDRLGDPATAFDAFSAMNRLAAAEVGDAGSMAQGYRAMIDYRVRLTTPEWLRGWTRARPRIDRPAPAFLVGFPRSGTTLLDTALAGHPGAVVVEEKPLLHEVAEALGPIDRLAGLGAAEIDRLRALYFEAADRFAPGDEGRLLIDKLPLGIVDTPLIHRLFPDARFIFVQRHPCDSVLSCFMTRFQPVSGLASFLDLAETALLYDRVMAYWRQCRAVFPLTVHLVRYERMLDDPESELRPLAAFLGLDWNPRLLEHRRNAVERGHIATPSYAQVTEPLNHRARGRWERYRERMQPVLPLLAPWAEQMGYRV